MKAFDTIPNQHDIEKALNLVQRWVEEHQYRGYEPFDGLSSWARPLMLGSLLGERLLMQTIRQSPFNLRPILGVRPKDSTKGRGYIASGYLARYRATGDQRYLHRAVSCLEWLDKNRVARFKHHCWSNHFDFASRGGSYTRHDPIIVWTSLIGYAYLDAFEITRKGWFLRVADSVCKWILQLPRERTASGDCLSYFADRQSSVHNSNMLGASILARTAKHTGNEEYREVARSAMEYSCSRQRADGSWWYGEEPKWRWIDNFHTGYNLDSLYFYMEATGDDEFRTNLRQGLAFYKNHFFEAEGCPRYYHTRKYPVDIQNAAQAIDTLVLASNYDNASLELGKNVAAWTIRHMQDPKGYFYYRRYPLIKAKTPMLHWGQATMFKALAALLFRMSAVNSVSPLVTADATNACHIC
jgi:rhamnogalacturonyl hydrolase YesR